MDNKPRILCAASWYDDGHKRPCQPKNIESGIVFAGYRHDMCLTNLLECYPLVNKHSVVNGFLTTDNMFVTRKEAAVIAVESGQISQNPDRLLLISEDLY